MKSISSKPQSEQKVYSKKYLFFKVVTTLILTGIVMIPVIFLLGSENYHHPSKLIYQFYEENSYLKGIVSEIESKLIKSSGVEAINLYSTEIQNQKISVKKQKQESISWQNLLEMADYFGYSLNRRGNLTIKNLIEYPIQNVTGTKKNQNKQTLIKAYEIDREKNVINYLKQKLSKTIKSIIARLNWKLNEKDTSFGGKLKNCLITFVRENTPQHVWITVLNPKNEEFHHPSTLIKKIEQWGKAYKNDALIIVSRQPIIVNSSKIIGVNININRQKIISEDSDKKDDKKEINAPFVVSKPNEVLSFLIERQRGSLHKVSQFIQVCKQNVGCYETVNSLRKEIQRKYVSKRNKKGDSICNSSVQSIQLVINKLWDKFEDEKSMISERSDAHSKKKQFSFYVNIIKADLCDSKIQKQLQKQIKQSVESEEKQNVKKRSKKEKQQSNQQAQFGSKDNIKINKTIKVQSKPKLIKKQKPTKVTKPKTKELENVRGEDAVGNKEDEQVLIPEVQQIKEQNEIKVTQKGQEQIVSNVEKQQQNSFLQSKTSSASQKIENQVTNSKEETNNAEKQENENESNQQKQSLVDAKQGEETNHIHNQLVNQQLQTKAQKVVSEQQEENDEQNEIVTEDASKIQISGQANLEVVTKTAHEEKRVDHNQMNQDKAIQESESPLQEVSSSDLKPSQNLDELHQGEGDTKIQIKDSEKKSQKNQEQQSLNVQIEHTQEL